MPIIELSLGWLLVINIAAWAIIHLVLSIMMARLPLHYFESDSFLYRTRHWEKYGERWQQLFAVKHWKERIPDGTKIIGTGFAKHSIQSRRQPYLEMFMKESRRAELTHWLSIPPALLFFLWNPAWAGWLMVVYALFFNIPIIIVQRYNRPRLQNMLKRMS